MTVSLKHAFTSGKSDGGDNTLVQPSNWNAEHTLTLANNRVLGRNAGTDGAAQELTSSDLRTLTGLATTDSPQFTALNVGHASDTTIARVSAGVISVEGSNVILASNKLSALSATTSAELAGVISDETGSGALVFGTSPIFTTNISVQSASGYGNMEIGGPEGAYIDMKAPFADDYDLRIKSDATENAFLGVGALPMTFSTNSSERMRITSGGLVGIGTTAPNKKLEVYENNTSEVAVELVRLSNPSSNATNNGVSLGLYQGSALYGRMRAYYNATSSWSLNFGAGAADHLTILTSGFVGIGSTNPAEELHVIGQGYFTAGAYIGSNASTNTLIDDASNGAGTTTLYIGNASITTSSDQRLKENITDTTVDALAKVQALRVVDFTWNDPSDASWNNKNARGTWTGLIAQEAIQHVPWAVNAPRDPDTMQPLPNAKDDAGNDQLWFMEYQQVVPVLIRAIQQQQAQISALDARIAALEA